MKFTITDEAIERLGLSTDLKGHMFAGPPVDEGLLARFTRAEIIWLKSVAGVTSTSDFDPMEVRMGYCVLSVRRDSPAWIPRKRFEPPESIFDQMADTDFQYVKHDFVPMPEDPRGCSECGQLGRARIHLTDEDPEDV